MQLDPASDDEHQAVMQCDHIAQGLEELGNAQLEDTKPIVDAQFINDASRSDSIESNNELLDMVQVPSNKLADFDPTTNELCKTTNTITVDTTVDKVCLDVHTSFFFHFIAGWQLLNSPFHH